ncbi:hypothetical protein MKX03_027173, partial [Papaver bracteatum]
MDTIRNNSWPFRLCVLLFGFVMCSKLHLTTAADTISLGDSLTGNQTIISSGGNFELGFFKPGNTSQSYYIGIWYKFSVQTVVWVANRDLVILDLASSKLTLLDGNLVLLSDLSSIPIWSTNVDTSTLNATEALLGDDGNLVLRDASNPSVVIWQSFDYPTDTWLPGGKIGFNKKTNKIQQLTSWKGREDPATGFYNYVLGPDRANEPTVYWNRSEEIWRSGEWDENSNTFPTVPAQILNSFFNFTYISDVNETYFTYSFYNKSTISRFVMDISGQFKQFKWLESNWAMVWVQPQRLCDVRRICGPFGNCNLDTQKCECLPGFIPRSPADWSFRDTYGGCVRRTPLQCGSKDSFPPIPSSNLPDIPRLPQIYSAEECKSSCQATCSCIGYAFFDNRCRYWDEDITNFKQFNTSSGGATTFYLRLAATEILSIVPNPSSPIPVSNAQ